VCTLVVQVEVLEEKMQVLLLLKDVVELEVVEMELMVTQHKQQL
jgi:hypothetical protein